MNTYSTGSIELTRRLQPKQKRAQESVEQILHTAAVLLDEVGLNAFNTNLLAERANVRVRTIYRYFPNKYSILAELARNLTHRMLVIVDGFAPLADPDLSVEQALDALFEVYPNEVRKIPGIIPIRHALRVCPELSEIREGFQKTLSERLLKALQQRQTGLPKKQLRIIAEMFVETSSAIMDYAEYSAKRRRNKLIRELQIMLQHYLTQHFA